MYLIDILYQYGIGVIFDWVLLYFFIDEYGFGYFDGMYLYEYVYLKQGFYLEWNIFIFNYGCNEVWSFLISSVLFWFDKYYIDGLWVDRGCVS